MEKKTKRGPLLYVSQTFLDTPVKNMQEIFTNRQEVQLPLEEPHVEEQSSKKVLEVSLAKTDLPRQSKVLEVKQEEKSQSNQEKKRTFNRVKGFKEMNLMERLEYLDNFPKALPPVPCVFYTDEKNYQGYLVEYNESDVTIRFPDQTTETIPFKSLQDVMMIGIKR
ncbi:CotO family spore coat protein [Neobacillus niacini]|uniref:CotO family spore coat protein n=1 Tax=Neobacillus niacini TaxID=86668 RepID=UPI0007AC136F|nr:CotO family spore coat protein [Neobacillus niacini]MEC1523976.1 CotO family spore coat protein [Neobacillus niacini]